MSLSDYDRANIQQILINPGGQYDWFSAYLIRLIAKADKFNRERIRLGFPEHVEAYETWYEKPRSEVPS